MIRLKKRILLILSINMFALFFISISMGAFDEEAEPAMSETELIDIGSEAEVLSEEFNRLETNAENSGQQSGQDFEGITPATIEIPDIDVEADIEDVGVLDNGQMGVPSDEDGVGWFEPGTPPGEIGNAVMAGHVDSYTGPAIFFDLEELESGDEVIVSDAEGRELVFTVQTEESYPLGEAPMDHIFGSADARNLNLITCAGTFNQDQGTHDERLVVYTELDEEKSDIEAEQDPPKAPTNVEVNDSFVSWHAVQDGDVAGYRVYRGDPEAEENDYEQIDSVSAHERKRISDHESETSEYRYYITSVDIHGKESGPSEQVGKE